jgi:type IV secretion system protein VirD4
MNYDMVYGYVNDQALAIANEKHTLIMASSRSGKGATLIIPHLLRYKGSAFVLDPKGENAYATGRTREKLNHKVHYLDPFGICGRGPPARFNPIARMTQETMDSDSQALAASLVIEGDAQDYLLQSAKQLIATFILHVFTSPELPPEAKDLLTIRKLLLRDATGILYVIAENETTADGLLAARAQSFLRTPGKELSAIISIAQRQTDVLDNPSIAACLAASGPGEEINFADWHDHTMTVYLSLPAPNFPVFNRWLRLVLVSAVNEMTAKLNPPELPICFMLDELATLGRIAAIENAIGLAAGYGIQLCAVFQDISQIKNSYENQWSSFISNAGVRTIFSVDDIDTAEYWSRFAGDRLVEDGDANGSRLTSDPAANTWLRRLLTPDEVMINYAKDYALLLVRGMRPISADRLPYWDTRTGLDGLWDDPRKREI